MSLRGAPQFALLWTACAGDRVPPDVHVPADAAPDIGADALDCASVVERLLALRDTGEQGCADFFECFTVCIEGEPAFGLSTRDPGYERQVVERIACIPPCGPELRPECFAGRCGVCSCRRDCGDDCCADFCERCPRACCELQAPPPFEAWRQPCETPEDCADGFDCVDDFRGDGICWMACETAADCPCDGADVRFFGCGNGVCGYGHADPE